jgi:hypothetical protein
MGRALCFSVPDSQEFNAKNYTAIFIGDEPKVKKLRLILPVPCQNSILGRIGAWRFTDNLGCRNGVVIWMSA